MGRPHETENKVRFGLQDHWTQRKRFRIRLQQVLQKARTKIPPLVAEVSLSFVAGLCTAVHEENWIPYRALFSVLCADP
jgi:hypothetical protein